VAGFSWFICNVFEEKNEDFWLDKWNVEEEFVYLRWRFLNIFDYEICLCR
jgi:hypothetical protein